LKLSKNFTLRELTKSQVAERLGIDNTPDELAIENMKLLCKHILQPVRDYHGVPFTVSSGYRSADLCSAIGSKPTSQHAYGEAADFEVPSLDNRTLALWIADNLDFDQLILECYTKGEPSSGWVHCSFSEAGNRKETLTYSKGLYTRGIDE